jgi:hypothetical protein
MIPNPISTSYQKITKRNAERFFQDCMAVKDERVDWIIKLATECGRSQEQFDLSRESLLPLWESVSGRISRIKPAPFEPSDTSGKPEWFNYLYPVVAARDEDLYSNHKGGYDLLSLWIMDGLSYYFGEVFVRTFPHVQWRSFIYSRYEMSGMPHVSSSEWLNFNVCPWQQVATAMARTWVPGMKVNAFDFIKAFDALVFYAEREKQ